MSLLQLFCSLLTGVNWVVSQLLEGLLKPVTINRSKMIDGSLNEFPVQFKCLTNKMTNYRKLISFSSGGNDT